MILTHSAAHQNLRRLCWIRGIALAAQCFLIYAGMTWLDLQLPLPSLSLVLVIFVLTTCIAYFRSGRETVITDYELGIHLLVDVILLSILLYLSGGATNPFVSYFLIPVTISAATLPWRFTGALAVLTLSSYTLLLFYYLPVLPDNAHQHHQHTNFFNWHIMGMWLNFVLSVGLITFFIVKMSTTIRAQRRQQIQHRESQLMNEQVLAIASLAAGTAHELRTPLSTLRILSHELLQEPSLTKDIRDDIITMEQQVLHCDQTLKNLLAHANDVKTGRWESEAPAQFIRKTLDHWQLIRPHSNYQLQLPKNANKENINLEHDHRLQQTLVNLLNNAADASQDPIDINVTWDEDDICIEIRDSGKGVTPDMTARLGQPFISTKSEGLGIGLFLSHATIAHYQGIITLTNRHPKGTLTTVKLPLKRKIQAQ